MSHVGFHFEMPNDNILALNGVYYLLIYINPNAEEKCWAELPLFALPQQFSNLFSSQAQWLLEPESLDSLDSKLNMGSAWVEPIRDTTRRSESWQRVKSMVPLAPPHLDLKFAMDTFLPWRPCPYWVALLCGSVPLPYPSSGVRLLELLSLPFPLPITQRIGPHETVFMVQRAVLGVPAMTLRWENSMIPPKLSNE